MTNKLAATGVSIVLLVSLGQGKETFSIAVGWRMASPASPATNSHKYQPHPVTVISLLILQMKYLLVSGVTLIFLICLKNIPLAHFRALV